MARIATGTQATAVDVAQYETFQESIKLVRGDTLPQIELTLRDKNTAVDGKTLSTTDTSTWAPIDLTGATVRFKFRAEGASEVKETIQMYAIGDPVNGNVFMQWGDDTLDTAGKFTGEIEITHADGKISTVFEQLSFIVREDY